MIKKEILITIIISILTVWGCQDTAKKEIPSDDVTVALEPNQRIINGKIMELEESGESTIVKGKVLKTKLSDESPGIELVYDTSSNLPRNSLRWIQIVVDAQPKKVPDITRPNFDEVMTKGEYDKDKQKPNHLQHKKNQRERERRINKHNPFMAEQRMFRDNPSYNIRFETYIILCYIVQQDSPEKRWKAEIAAVWHWIWETGNKASLNKISQVNQAFKQKYAGANADFLNSFHFDVWYKGEPPSPN